MSSARTAGWYKRQRSPPLENLMYHRVNVLWQGVDGWIRWTVVGLGAPILALTLVYWGYCWHWWGRDTLALQYLFQCRCPPASEATRYPNFTVLVSACRNMALHDLSADGRSLTIQGRNTPAAVAHLDLHTHQEVLLPFDPTTVNRVYPLDQERVLVRFFDPGGYVIYHHTDGIQTPVSWQRFDEQPPQYQKYLQNAVDVFVFTYETLIVTTEDTRHPGDHVVFRDIRSAEQAELNTQLLRNGVSPDQLHMSYQPGNRLDIRHSPDGRFYARWDGIYRTDTQEQLINTDLPFFDRRNDFRPVGWLAGQRGVVYGSGAIYLLDGRDDILLSYLWFPVPQPILLLELPEEFWTE